MTQVIRWQALDAALESGEIHISLLRAALEARGWRVVPPFEGDPGVGVSLLRVAGWSYERMALLESEVARLRALCAELSDRVSGEEARSCAHCGDPVDLVVCSGCFKGGAY